MQLSWIEIQSRALQFSKKWKDAKDEASEAQSFLNEFFEIFGVDRKRIATFEKKVPMSSNRNGYIDLLWKGVILVEMKAWIKLILRRKIMLFILRMRNYLNILWYLISIILDYIGSLLVKYGTLKPLNFTNM